MSLQSSYKKIVDERMVAIKSQHSQKVHSLTRQLEKLKSDQVQHLTELKEFRAEFCSNSKDQVREIEQRYKGELKELRERLEGQFSKDLSSFKAKHNKEVACLKKDFEKQMAGHELSMAQSCDEMLAAAQRSSEERENSLRHEYAQREEELKRQTSTLSGDLRVARDKLALSEQKVVHILSQLDINQASSAETKAKLEESEGEMERLNSVLREMKNKLAISNESYQQQSEEMKGLSCEWEKWLTLITLYSSFL